MTYFLFSLQFYHDSMESKKSDSNPKIEPFLSPLFGFLLNLTLLGGEVLFEKKKKELFLSDSLFLDKCNEIYIMRVG